MKKGTTVAVLGANDVPKMLEQVTEQIKLIKGSLPTTPKTTEALPEFGKIDNINNLSTIIKATSMVMGKECAYNEAAKVIVPENIKVPTFKLNKMEASAILDHLKSRAIEVANKEQLDKLTKIQAKLKENLSAEAKLANDLADIKGILEE